MQGSGAKRMQFQVYKIFRRDKKLIIEEVNRFLKHFAIIALWSKCYCPKIGILYDKFFLLDDMLKKSCEATSFLHRLREFKKTIHLFEKVFILMFKQIKCELISSFNTFPFLCSPMYMPLVRNSLLSFFCISATLVSSFVFLVILWRLYILLNQ